MKKKWIIIAAAAVIIILAVIVTVLLVNRSTRQADIPLTDPECRYPYTLENDGKNVIIRVTGDFGGYTWSSETRSPDPAVRVTAGEADESSAAFTVEPVQYGTDKVVLTLKKEGVLPDICYAITVSFLTDDDGTMTVIGASHAERSGLRDHPEGDHPYAVAEDTDGSLLVQIRNVGDGEWAVLAENESCVKTEQKDAAAGTLLYRISPTDTGTDVVRFCQTEEGQALTVEVSVDASLRLTAEEKGFAAYDYTAGKKEKEARGKQTAVAEMIGTLTIPESFTIAGQSTSALIGEDQTVYPIARFDLVSGETPVVFCVSRRITSEALLFNYVSTDDTQEEIPLGETSGTLYRGAQSALLVWKDEGGSFFWVTADVGNTSLLTEAAALLQAENPSLSEE